MKELMKSDTIGVSIVMPCLNEAATIAKCVRRAQDALKIIETRFNLLGEVIVADNGSSDGSQDLARAEGARVVDVPEAGYGAALKGGFAAAHGQFLVMGDSDCSYDFVESVPMIAKLIDGADLCMGSRFNGEIKPGAMPWKNRYIGNPVLSAILRLLFRSRISDAHCGIRAITRESYDALNLSSNGMEFASEMVLKSSLRYLNIAEVPVTLSPDERGRAPHLKPWRDGFRHLFYMLMLSPTWLFMLPAAAMALMGIVLFALLLTGDPDMVRIGRIGIGDHWAVVASSALIIAVQTGIIGIASLMLSFREGMRIPTERAKRILSYSRLPNWLMAGMATMLVGLIWAAVIAGGWIASDFGALDEMRGLIAAFTAIVIGVQLCFGGFLLSVVNGNRLRHAYFL